MMKDGDLVIQVFMFRISYLLIALENSIIHASFQKSPPYRNDIVYHRVLASHLHGLRV